MKKAKIILWAALTFTFSILYLNLSPIHRSSTGMDRTPITGAEMQSVFEATIQLVLFPTDSLEALGGNQQNFSLNEALSRNNGPYRYELGLGTLVSHNGEIILITHDHWGSLDTLGMVQFRNAAGDPLLELGGDTFKDLIRYQDGGTLILGKSVGGDRSDYLGALVGISQAKYSRRIVPAKLGAFGSVRVGESLIVVRQDRNTANSVELIAVTVASIEERWGQPVYKLRGATGENIMPGDSGGGLWLGGHFVGNMWKSNFTYGWNWDALELEKKWTEISYAAGLPGSLGDILQGLNTAKFIDDVESPRSGQEL